MYGSEQGGYMDMLIQAMMSQQGQQPQQPMMMDEMQQAQQPIGTGVAQGYQPSPTIGRTKKTEAPPRPRGYPGQSQQQQSGQDNPLGDLMSNWNDTMATAGYGEDYGEDNEGSYLSPGQADSANSAWDIFSALYGGGSGGGGGG